MQDVGQQGGYGLKGEHLGPSLTELPVESLGHCHPVGNRMFLHRGYGRSSDERPITTDGVGTNATCRGIEC